MSSWLEHTVTDREAGSSLESVLLGSLNLSRRSLQKLTRSKGIRLNRKPTFLARVVKTGDVITVRSEASANNLVATAMDLAICYEDSDLIVLNKPPGIAVHPVQPNAAHTLANGLTHYYQQQGSPAGVHCLHRLDRDTSGLLLVAKSAIAHAQLDQQLRQRQIDRVYQAIVAGVVEPDQGKIEAPIGRHSQRAELRAVHAQGEAACTHFRVLERWAGATRLELVLETGRTHQIRVHLQHLGYPVLGDRQYGQVGCDRFPRQALHAYKLRFRQPRSGELLVFEVPLAADLKAATSQLNSA
jgi:23S rRNA pseudouridine1911/1915/1917 synthase